MNFKFLGGCPLFILSLNFFLMNRQRIKLIWDNFLKNRFFYAKTRKGQSTLTIWQEGWNATHMILILVKIDKSSRQRRPFDSLSRTSQKRLIKNVV